METLYMKVTKDEYELPIAASDTINGLAKIIGVDRTTVFRGLKRKGSGYLKVDIEPDKDLQAIKNKIVSEGVRYFELAKTELEFHGNSTEYNKLLGISDGLRMALSIIFECGKSEENIEKVKKIS